MSPRWVSERTVVKVGGEFGRLTAIRQLTTSSLKSRFAYWEFECECGERVVLDHIKVRSKKNQNCGVCTPYVEQLSESTRLKGPVLDEDWINELSFKLLIEGFIHHMDTELRAAYWGRNMDKYIAIARLYFSGMPEVDIMQKLHMGRAVNVKTHWLRRQLRRYLHKKQ
jgi:hypothetical protein